MRREELPLVNVIEHADQVAGIVADIDEPTFAADSVLHAAVTYHLIVLREAVSRLPREVWNRHPEVAWRRVVDFRNFVIHGYDAVIWSRVWAAATVSAPELRRHVWQILEADYPEAAAALSERGH